MIFFADISINLGGAVVRERLHFQVGVDCHRTAAKLAPSIVQASLFSRFGAFDEYRIVRIGRPGIWNSIKRLWRKT